MWAIILGILVALCLCAGIGTYVALQQTGKSITTLFNNASATLTAVSVEYDATATAIEQEFNSSGFDETATAVAEEFGPGLDATETAVAEQFGPGVDATETALAGELGPSLDATETAAAEMIATPGTSGDATPVEAPTATAEGTSNNGSTGATGGGVGSTLTSGDFKITLNSINRQSAGLIPPTEGNEYLILNLTFENTSAESKPVSSLLQFELKDSNGHKYDIALFGPDVKDLIDGDVPANNKKTGDTAFEVPKSAAGLTFTYSPILGGDEVTFKLDK